MNSEKKRKLATMWLDGCSGCHMSFLDIDERLISLLDVVDIVYSPLVDAKEYPENVDICLVEGAVASEEDVRKLKIVRMRTTTLIALGDCSVTGNLPSMRNPIGVKALIDRIYDGFQPGEVPTLLPQATPIHRHVKVDLYVPGCPPSADAIFAVLSAMLAGRQPDVLAVTRFGA